jgi:predicted anti-sigma-YlaC factor YlaD
MAMSEHVRELLPLAAAGTCTPAEAARVASHLRLCGECAAEAESWGRLAEGLRRLPVPAPSRELAALTLEAVERCLAERSERAWNRAAFAFLVAFAWTLALVSWLLIDLVAGELSLRLARPLGPTAAWYAVYLLAGWLSAGAAAVLLGSRAREEGGVA